MAVSRGSWWDMFADIDRVNAWLDKANARTEHENSMRVMKIFEEIGEVFEAYAATDAPRSESDYARLGALSNTAGRAVRAYIGMTGQNPRKGVTHTETDMVFELADVAVTALCAIQHFTQDTEVTRAFMAAKLQEIIMRAGIPEREPARVTTYPAIPADD
jgi:hypothetical protein